MIGLTPWARHASYISTAPFITPWSVSPRAGIPSSAARAAIRSILHAPSSSEYSLWTCRWTACPALEVIGIGARLPAGADGAPGPRADQRGACGSRCAPSANAGRLDALHDGATER